MRNHRQSYEIYTVLHERFHLSDMFFQYKLISVSVFFIIFSIVEKQFYGKSILALEAWRKNNTELTNFTNFNEIWGLLQFLSLILCDFFGSI